MAGRLKPPEPEISPSLRLRSGADRLSAAVPALLIAAQRIAQTIVQLEAPRHLRGRLIGLFSMSAFGLRAFSGLTVGVIGGLIGIHWSLALSSLVLLTVTLALLAFAQQRQTVAEPG